MSQQCRSNLADAQTLRQPSWRLQLNRSDHRPRLSRSGKLLAGLFVGLSVVVVALTVCVASVERQWEAFRAELAGKGEPLTFDEIDRMRSRFADGLTTAKLVMELTETIQQIGVFDRRRNDVLGFGGRSPADFFTGISTRVVDRSREFLSTNRELVASFSSIGSLPPGVFGLAFQQDWPDLVLSHAEPIRAISRLIVLDATVALLDQRVADAADSVVLQFRLSEALAEEVSLLGWLTRRGIRDSAILTIENCLRVGTLDTERLAGCQLEIEYAYGNSSMRWALLGERAAFVRGMEFLMTGRRLPPNHPLERARHGAPIGLLRSLVRNNQIEGVRQFERLIRAADDPSALSLAGSEVAAEVNASTRSLVFVRHQLSDAEQYGRFAKRSAAELQAARAGIAAERFRLKSGRFPEALSELVPEFLDSMPVDPWDGNQLRLVTTEQGITVYSVGPDLADDGGNVVRRRESRGRRAASQRGFDIGFRLLHEEHRGVVLIDARPPQGN